MAKISEYPRKREKHKHRQSFVERVYKNPGLIEIRGEIVDPDTVLSKKKDFWYAREFGYGYWVDIALLRKTSPDICEVDMIRVIPIDDSKSARYASMNMGNLLEKCYKENLPGFIEKLSGELRFRQEYCKELWTDISIGSIIYPNPDKIEWESPWRYKRKIDNYSSFA